MPKAEKFILRFAAPYTPGYNAGRQGMSDMATTGRSRVHPSSSGMEKITDSLRT
jgi:hypothetical protein